MTAEGEIAREARRVLRRLLPAGARLVPHGTDSYRVASRDKAARDAPLAAAAVEAFLRNGWLSRNRESGSCVLTDAGRGFLARAAGGEDAFAAQHQIRRARRIRDADGIERQVTVDEGESPLAWLRARGLVGAAQFEAGEKLRRDYTLAHLTPRLGVDYSAPMVLGRRGQKKDANFADTVLAARQRFAAAMRAVGPGLSDLLYDVCCHWRGLEEVERAHRWPSRTGRVVLAIALDRLAEHYGMRMRGTGKPRAWRSDDEAPAG